MSNVELKKLEEKLSNLKGRLSQAEQGFSVDDNSTLSFEDVVCEKHGLYREFKREMAGLSGRIFTSYTACPRCLREQIAQTKNEIVASKNKALEMKISSLKAHSGVPTRFVNSSFANYQTSEKSAKAKGICQRYAAVWNERKAVGGGLILCGKPGTGKNHLACAIANQIIEQYQDSVLLTTALRISRKIKSTWAKDAEESEWEAMQIYCEPDLLIIDEIGVQFGSDAEKIILFEIINNRYEDMKPTILISNLSQEELSQYVGERIIDRMKEGQGVVVNFDWESFRK